MSRSHKIVFDGAYGIRSFGDDAPMLVLLDALRSRLPSVQAVVVARHAELQPYKSCDVRCVGGLEYGTKVESVGRWFRGFNPDDDRKDLCLLRQEIADADLLVLGAGNFLNDSTIDLLKGPVPRFLIMSLMAAMTGTPVMWYGISIGPLDSVMGRDMARLAASLASVITVRDESSLTWLSKLGVKAGGQRLPDPVLGIRPADPGSVPLTAAWMAAHAQGRPVIAVALRWLPGVGEQANLEHLDLVSFVLDQLIERHDVRVLFVPQCTYDRATPDQDDRHTARLARAKMHQSSRAFLVEDELDAKSCLQLYQGAAAAICSRLHGCVFAALNEVPVVAMSYHFKVAEFMASSGLSGDCRPVAEVSADWLLSKAEQLLNAPETHLATMRESIAVRRPQIDEYARLAMESIQRKAQAGPDISPP